MIDRLILARHGESVFSKNGLVNGDPLVDGPLTSTGRQQADELRSRLLEERIDLCITSEFHRVRQTADLALAGRAVARRIEPLLNDPRAGRFEGGSASEYGEWHAAADWFDAPPGGGESQLSIINRYLHGYRAVLSSDADCVLVVAHALPIGFARALTEHDRPPIRHRYDDDIPLATPIVVPPSELEAGLARAFPALARVLAGEDSVD